MTHEELMKAAENAMQLAYAPYSNFKVGAALLCGDGTVFTGCNVENASYGVTNCAERTALFKAVSEGHTDFVAIAIVGGPDGVSAGPCYPCGTCRQALAEFVKPDFEVCLKDDAGTVFVCNFNELLPNSFNLHN